MSLKTKLLLGCGAVGSPFFVIVFTLLGSTQPGYDPIRFPVSSLSIGPSGWIQVTNFIITGLLLLAFSSGLYYRLKALPGKTREPLLIALAGTGLIASGLFSSDAVYGYPPDRTFASSQFTLHGNLHVLSALLVFICLPAACFMFRKRFITANRFGWAIYSRITGIVMIVMFSLAGVGFKQALGLTDFAGLLQRISIIAGWAWMTLIALFLLNDNFLKTSKK